MAASSIGGAHGAGPEPYLAGGECIAELRATNAPSANDRAILAAADRCRANGGGTIRLPPGRFLLSGISLDPVVYPNISVRGAGKAATLLVKGDQSETPVLQISSNYLSQAATSYGDFSISCESGPAAGFRTRQIAIFTVRNISITRCRVGWENQGSLIVSSYDVDLDANEVGYRQTLNGLVYPNLITFFGGQVINNRNVGFDFVHGQGITLDHVDIEHNGTTGDPRTGGVFIRSSVVKEVNFATYSIVNNTWFEGNRGSGLTVEPAANLSVTQSDTHYFRNSSKDAVGQIDIGAIESSVMTNVSAVSSLADGMTTSISASRSTIAGGQFTQLRDTSQSQWHMNVATYKELIGLRSSGGADIGGQVVSRVYELNGRRGSLKLPLKSDISAGAGATLLIVGADASGAAFARNYLLAMRPGGGSGAPVSVALVSSAGSTEPRFEWSTAEGQLVVSVTNGNTARISFTGIR